MNEKEKMSFSEKLVVLKSVFMEKESYLVMIPATFLIGFIMFRFTYFDATYYNIGPIYAISQAILQLVLAVLFGINVAMLWHKLKFTSKFSAKEAHTTTLSAIFGVVVSGCPACGITIASYVGLASFFASLPFMGMELKLLGIILLLYSINSLAKNMYACEIKVPV